MTLDQLHVLECIIKTGSFRAASQELHRAQSAVSYAIRSLESELGFKIFSRDQYRPQLTAQGKVFSKKMQYLLREYSDLQESAEFLKLGHEPVIRIAVSSLWPLPLLVKALKDFKKKYAQTEIKIIHDVMSNDEQLIEDRADIAFGTLFNDKGLIVSQELFPVRMLAVCSSEHPLTKFKGKTPDSELARHPQVIMSSTGNANRSGGIVNPTNVISVQEYLTKKTFLLEGLGWGLMPEHLVATEIKNKSLVTLTQKPFKTMTHIARHSQRELGPCGKFLWDYFSHGQKIRPK